jgi:molecular chaperone GrpE (heat shock protein)
VLLQPTPEPAHRSPSIHNARQRAESDKASAKADAVASVVTAWLPLLDSFDAALDAQAAVEARSGPPPAGEVEIHSAYRALHSQLLELLRWGGRVGGVGVAAMDALVGVAVWPRLWRRWLPCPNQEPRAKAFPPPPLKTPTNRRAGVEVMSRGSQEGKPFDPQIHEAVMREVALPGFKPDSVTRVLRAGYFVGDRLIRPALVAVAAD